MPDLFELAAATRALAVDAERLTATVEINNDRVDALSRRIDRAEGLITRTWAFLAVLVVLSGLLGVLLFRQVVTEDRLGQVITAEHEARQKGQCPLLALFISAYNPDRRSEGTSREQYEEAFKTIRQSYADLHCDAPDVAGGRATAPPVAPAPTR